MKAFNAGYIEDSIQKDIRVRYDIEEFFIEAVRESVVGFGLNTEKIVKQIEKEFYKIDDKLDQQIKTYSVIVARLMQAIKKEIP